MLRLLPDTPPFAIKRVEIATGSLFINKPTVFALAVAIVYLLMADPWEGWKVQVPCDGSVSTEEIFVTGLISFHLVASAVAYALTKISWASFKSHIHRGLHFPARLWRG